MRSSWCYRSQLSRGLIGRCNYVPPEHNEQSRREIIWRLEQEDFRLRTQAAPTKADADKLEQRLMEVDSALRRAQLHFPPGDLCPECWITQGVKSSMKN